MAANGNVAVTLAEFVIDTEDTFTAGEVTFDVVNDATSEFNHEFAIIAADSYDELPKLGNGAVDEEALAEGQLLGRTERLEPGQAETITFDLEPGTYVFVCNIHFGPNSHAANGQVLEVTVNPVSAEATDDNVAVTLSEFVIDTEDTFTAGEVTFDVVNDATSEFNHELTIIAADSYDELPKLGNGAVDEEALAEGQLLGRTERLEPGQAETITFDLEPGTYVFVCNIHFGPNSHAANGQTLTVTVGP